MHRVGFSIVCLCLAQVAFAGTPTVRAVRTPDGGLQPQVAVDADGAAQPTLAA